MKKSLLPREIGKQINESRLTNKQKYITRQIIRRVNKFNIAFKNIIIITLNLPYRWIEIQWFSSLQIRINFDSHNDKIRFCITGDLDNAYSWEQCELIQAVVCIKNGPHQKLSL